MYSNIQRLPGKCPAMNYELEAFMARFFLDSPCIFAYIIYILCTYIYKIFKRYALYLHKYVKERSGKHYQIVSFVYRMNV